MPGGRRGTHTSPPLAGPPRRGRWGLGEREAAGAAGFSPSLFGGRRPGAAAGFVRSPTIFSAFGDHVCWKRIKARELALRQRQAGRLVAARSPDTGDAGGGGTTRGRSPAPQGCRGDPGAAGAAEPFSRAAGTCRQAPAAGQAGTWWVTGTPGTPAPHCAVGHRGTPGGAGVPLPRRCLGAAGVSPGASQRHVSSRSRSFAEAQRGGERGRGLGGARAGQGAPQVHEQHPGGGSLQGGGVWGRGTTPCRAVPCR